MSRFIYSIVIPHYNSPLLLQRMLDSIPQREDIQVIVVDDCSTADNIEQLKLCHHSNLEIVYLSEKHGAGYARNIGLSKAEGKWLLVVDADDYFAENAFTVFDKYTESNYEYICYCISALDCNSVKNGRKIVSDQIVRKYLENKNDKTLLAFRYLNNVCWNKLVMNDFVNVNKINFEESLVNNDVRYNLSIGLKAKKFIVIPDELYCAVENKSSITRKKRDLEREFMFFLQVQKRNGFYEKLGFIFF